MATLKESLKFREEKIDELKRKERRAKREMTGGGLVDYMSDSDIDESDDYDDIEHSEISDDDEFYEATYGYKKEDLYKGQSDNIANNTGPGFADNSSIYSPDKVHQNTEMPMESPVKPRYKKCSKKANEIPKGEFQNI